MRNLNDLANDFVSMANSLDKFASEIAVKATIEIIRDLVNITPVDTSQAISNWQISLNNKTSEIIKPYVPGYRGSTKRASADEVIAKAISILKTKTPGQSIWIQNNLPYIRRLNDGYSRQAPAGYVERSLLIGRIIIKQAKFKWPKA
jgi:hypothetical protein